MKIDVDQLSDSVKLKHSFRLPFYDSDVMVYGRINLHYADQKLFVYQNHPLMEPHDQWLIKNNNLTFKFFSGYPKNIQQVNAREILHIPWKHWVIKTE